MAELLSLVLKSDEVTPDDTNPDGTETGAALAHRISKAVLVVDLSKSCIWVHVVGLPLPQLNKENACRIGEAFAGFLDYEISKENILNASPVMRIKAEFWVEKPLPAGFTNNISDELKPWVRFQYEDILELCWFCGRLGHTMLRCSSRTDDEMPLVYDFPEKGYGHWLHASTPLHQTYALTPMHEDTDTGTKDGHSQQFPHTSAKSNGGRK
ncbi:hypothetical protein Tsubulata_013801 [Turnera subulata]|uniref:Zinc knuckle CX2CX4HX4C domain-containing protein n=1 Tax=Turnera subulata TaxID=218843 RepID=A0A9Q0GB90_9ROSI|nr:hypothetical protein Tsubulata_013799 [Turnera subulata]KAJ4846564.1 hypothetical protein Tsubulata_013801 [Turnera subulata]